MRLLGSAAARVGASAITLLTASILVFLAIHLVPGSYQQVVLGPAGTQVAQARLAQEFGLDRSLPEQYLRWLVASFHGDFGISLVTKAPVMDEFARRLNS